MSDAMLLPKNKNSSWSREKNVLYSRYYSREYRGDELKSIVNATLAAGGYSIRTYKGRPKIVVAPAKTVSKAISKLPKISAKISTNVPTPRKIAPVWSPSDIRHYAD